MTPFGVVLNTDIQFLFKVFIIQYRYDADILIGYEVQKSSWGYLVERAAALNINLTGQLSRIPGDDKLSHK